ncbi:methylenetetrahydrofolate reductase [Actibacterium sp. MT2.3-13A]|uniref:methylenetetrahydrofolate reductase n=1 Tax=Actibacterium sp. MT2.3-13A TaxID=2828332 RepID=UPI001BA81B0F|nr:methylenetetrahydrofolate reductase [Actibacterium sp. MT2.3-13A]
MLSFIGRPGRRGEATGAGLHSILQGYSIEVMPRTAATIGDFREVLPEGTRVYIAHIEGTPIEDMVATAARLAGQGFAVMPHFPARIIRDRAMLGDWIKRYRGEAGVDQALLLAGGLAAPRGDFENSMQLMETGLFDAQGFARLHVAGHPEGNRDIDPDGGSRAVDEALRWKQAFSERSDAEMAIVTQFVFEARPVLDWAARLRAAGIGLPVHVGIAGPAKLQTLIKFAIACGVGPSLKVLQKRAKDVSRLLQPYEPTEILTDFAEAQALSGGAAVAKIHFFPLGGIRACADWAGNHGALPMRAAG